jgi:hypothetical protein
MSKKKSSTTKPADRPSMIPIMKSKAAKKKGRGPTEAEPTSTFTALDMPQTEAAGASPVAAETLPETAEAVPVAAETRLTDAAATPDAELQTAPAAIDAAAPAANKGKSRAKKEAKSKKMSALDAAAKVLAETGTAMTTGEMIEAMAKKKLWSSPNGQTPAATLYSAILREINVKGKDSRFAKTERGKFATKT